MAALELGTLLSETLVGKDGGAMNRVTGLVSVTVVGVGPQSVQTVTIFIQSEGIPGLCVGAVHEVHAVFVIVVVIVVSPVEQIST